MFDRIAQKYDLLNGVTSMGFDRLWRKKAVAALNLSQGNRLLDLAAGTLDISIAAARKYPDIHIVAADPSRGMLQVGRHKRAMTPSISLVAANGEALPLLKHSLHGAIIAFGIRNFSNRHAALRELSRVLVPGGRLVILELTTPQGGIFSPLARFYVQKVIPGLGALLSSGAEYAYLPKSMARFPLPSEFAAELTDAGFSSLRIERFMSGACHLYICESAPGA